MQSAALDWGLIEWHVYPFPRQFQRKEKKERKKKIRRGPGRATSDRFALLVSANFSETRDLEKKKKKKKKKKGNCGTKRTQEVYYTTTSMLEEVKTPFGAQFGLVDAFR